MQETKNQDQYEYRFILEHYDFPKIRDIKVKVKEKGKFKSKKIFEFYYTHFMHNENIIIKKDQIKMMKKFNDL